MSKKKRKAGENDMIDVIEMLTHFGLEDDPFCKASGAGVYRSRKYKTTLNVLESWMSKGEMCGVFGEPGSGKSTLIQDLEAQCRKGGMTLVNVGHPSREEARSSDVYSAVSLAFAEHGLKFSRSLLVRFSELREFIGDTMEGERVGLVVDECHRYRGSFIKALKEFSEASWASRTDLIGVLFSGWPCFMSSARRHSPDVHLRLTAKRKYIQANELMRGEVGEYVRWACGRCGNRNAFDAGALAVLGTLAKTPLRAIEHCWRGMETAYKAGRVEVTASDVVEGLSLLDRKEALGISYEELGSAVDLTGTMASKILRGVTPGSAESRERIESTLDKALAAGGLGEAQERRKAG